jgi:putative transposase
MPAKPQPPLEPEQLYHVYNHANGSDNLFAAEKNYRFFLKLYSFYISGITDTFAYCLMPNHFHFVLRIKPEEELKMFYQQSNPASAYSACRVMRLNSLQFSRFLNAYAQAFNKQQQRRGGLFNEPFKRKCITSTEYLLNLILYIHNNPVHHGFVKKMDGWKFSSYHALFSKEKTLLKRTELLELFGGIKECKEFHLRKIDTGFLQTVEFD